MRAITDLRSRLARKSLQRLTALVRRAAIQRARAHQVRLGAVKIEPRQPVRAIKHNNLPVMDRRNDRERSSAW